MNEEPVRNLQKPVSLWADQSAEIGELAAALAKAQGEMSPAPRRSDNPFFKSTYADNASVREAAKGPLSKNGLSVVQVPHMMGTQLMLRTMLMHSSGQWIAGDWPVNPTKNDPQGLGSATTYARRYSYCALTGMTQEGEDDDGNAASKNRGDNKAARSQGQDATGDGAAPPPKQEPKPTSRQGAITDNQRKRLFAISKANGWTEEQLRNLLFLQFGAESTGDLTLAQYNALCGDKKKKLVGILESPPDAEPQSDAGESSDPENTGTDAGGGGADDAYVGMAEKIMAAKERGDKAALRKLLLEAGTVPGLTEEHKDSLAKLFEEAMNDNSAD